MYGRVYVVVNHINDKAYVGQTIQSVKERWRSHGKPSSSRRHGIFAKAVQKYGKQNFSVHEVFEAESKEQLDSLEKLWIWVLQSCESSHGYNMTYGGDGSLTEATRFKMRGKRPAQSKRQTGVKRPQHVIDALRLANIGKPQSAETREKHRLANLGRKHTPEFIEKCRIAKKNYWESRRLLKQE